MLVVPGGGTGHPGAHDAVQISPAAAYELARARYRTVLVASAPSADTTAPAALQRLPRLPLIELATLMRRAQLVIANGGSTLLQAIACRAPCIAGLDRARSGAAGTAVRGSGHCRSAPLEHAHIVKLATALIDDEVARAALARRAADLQLADGLGIALAAIASLLFDSAASRLDLVGALRPHALLGYQLAAALVSLSDGESGGRARSGGLARAAGEIPAGRYGLRTWERRADAAALERGRAASDQAQRPGSALASALAALPHL